MNQLFSKFDPYAMIKPKTDADIALLLDEACRELDVLSELLADVTRRCEQNKKSN